ncbi:PPE domain-containing protein [Nocardia arthritidis]|uniref:PPE domain-containing protein n=1 Tax=Nocardia arthritidis TaxID=228602 RepID=A0A6G9Y4M0_9NOCA|nr:PPE domain-containing protein [Nocardia arthritidis]QIS08047.1 PPE domain-containing protein [Nocardia arthritidis]
MTAGITGVFWLPRLAEGNALALESGAHAVPIYAASTAWGALTGAWVDATATVARVIAEVGVGLEGINGLSVLSKLAGFTGWAEQQGVMAAGMAAKAAANATAYTIASIAMPNPVEIAAADTARVAAYSTGGVLNGSAEAAEAAKAALDLRAALTMETYEAATSAMVATPSQFINPPAIAHGAGTADPNQAAQQTAQQAQADPVQTAIAAATALANNPAVASVATQAANVVGSIATTGVSGVGTAATSALSAVTSISAPSVTAAAPMTFIGGGVAAGAAAAATSTGTRSASVGVGTFKTVSLSSGSLKLPEGWGNGISGSGAPTTEPVAKVETGVPVRPASATAPGTSPLLGRQAQDEDDESLHNTPDYLRSADNFADGRLAADGVIGAEPAGTAK